MMRALALGCALAVSLALLVAGSGRLDAAQKAHRYGSVIKVRADRLAEYKKVHAAVWPAVLKQIRRSHIRNYSIYYKDGYLFSYFEYTGSNFAKDMAKMAADKTTQKWWKLTEPMQEPLETRRKGEWWASMEEVFHMD